MHVYKRINDIVCLSVVSEIMYKGIPHTLWLVAGAISNGHSCRLRIIAVTDILQPGIVKVFSMNFTHIVENTGSSYDLGDVINMHAFLFISRRQRAFRRP